VHEGDQLRHLGHLDGKGFHANTHAHICINRLGIAT
jgi:hypothetical protein